MREQIIQILNGGTQTVEWLAMSIPGMRGRRKSGAVRKELNQLIKEGIVVNAGIMRHMRTAKRGGMGTVIKKKLYRLNPNN